MLDVQTVYTGSIPVVEAVPATAAPQASLASGKKPRASVLAAAAAGILALAAALLSWLRHRSR